MSLAISSSLNFESRRAELARQIWPHIHLLPLVQVPHLGCVNSVCPQPVGHCGGGFGLGVFSHLLSESHASRA
jgi:hypothetical protein